MPEAREILTISVIFFKNSFVNFIFLILQTNIMPTGVFQNRIYQCPGIRCFKIEHNKFIMRLTNSIDKKSKIFLAFLVLIIYFNIN